MKKRAFVFKNLIAIVDNNIDFIKNVDHSIFKENYCIFHELDDDVDSLFKFDSEYGLVMTETGEKCDFLKFLKNTSDFYWKKNPADISPEEKRDNNLHFISKLCAIGYLLSYGKEASNCRAVIAMDGCNDNSIPDSRSGKSLFSNIFKYILDINKYESDEIRDDFNSLFRDVTPLTQIIILDDLRLFLKLEELYPYIVKDWHIKKYRDNPVHFSAEGSPKILISSRENKIPGDGAFDDVIWPIFFSDYYSRKRSPEHEFGVLFLDWDYEQWNLFYTLLLECIILYNNAGYVPSPSRLKNSY